MASSLWLRFTLSFSAVSAAALTFAAGCSAPADDATGTSGQAVVEDMLAIVPLGNGSFRVTCRGKNGAADYDETASADDIRRDRVCRHGAGGPSGTTCAARLAHVRPSWSGSDLRWVCEGMDADCIVDLAAARTNWNGNDLRFVCEGMNAGCITGLAKTCTSWTSTDLRFVCNGVTSEEARCIPQLAPLRTSWTGTDLRFVCEGMDATCIIGLTTSRPSWNGSDDRFVCEGMTGSKARCIADLAETHPSWGGQDLRQACGN